MKENFTEREENRGKLRKWGVKGKCNGFSVQPRLQCEPARRRQQLDEVDERAGG